MIQFVILISQSTLSRPRRGNPSPAGPLTGLSATRVVRQAPFCTLKFGSPMLLSALAILAELICRCFRFVLCGGVCQYPEALHADIMHLNFWSRGISQFGHLLLLHSYRTFAWRMEHFAYEPRSGYA